MRDTHDISRPATPIAAATVLAILLLLAFHRGASGLYGEDGPVEIGSALALLAAAAAFATAAKDALRRFWQVPAALVFAAAREFDLDKSLLSGGILKSRFYLGDHPAWEKAIGLALVSLALWTAIRLFRYGLPAALRAARAGAAWPLLAVGALVAVVLAKGFDGIGRKLSPLGIDVPQALDGRLSRAEEWLELGAALAVLVAVMLYARRRPTPQETRCPPSSRPSMSER
jgi:hypothetical protein